MLIRELVTKLGFQADEAKVKKFDTAVKGLTIGLAAVVAAASAAAAAAFHFAGQMAEQGDEIAKTSRELGIASEQLQVFRFAAQRSGLSVEELNTSLRFAQKGLLDAAKGEGPMSDALKALGVSAKGADGQLRTIGEMMPELADKIAGMSNEAERAALITDIFGRSGGKMALLLREGSDGLDGFTQELQKYGAIISEEALAQSEAFQDNLLNLKMVFAGLGATVGAELLPVFNELMLLAKNIILQNKDLINEKLTAFVRKMLDVTVTLVEYAVDMLPVVYAAIETIYNITKTVINALGGVDAVIEMIGTIIALATAVVTIIGVMNASTVLLVAAAVAGAAVVNLAIDQLFKAIGGWFRDLIKNTPSALKGMFEWIKQGVRGLVTSITAVVTIIGVMNASTVLLVAAAVAGAAVAKLAIDQLFKAIGGWFNDLIKNTPSALKGMFEWIKQGVRGLVTSITALIPQWIKDLLQGKLKLPSLQGLAGLGSSPPKPSSSGSNGNRTSVASTANVNQTLNFPSASSPQQVASATGGATRTAIASMMNPLDLASVGA